ncbi:MAG TPA: DUF5668 domain-containing protein [Ignavibacteriaceae bacterium]|nr:DUF5668 domain-containing protein [Ignavibacteriaceae bacterium]
MKPKHLFWGLLFITLGILILINNFSGLYWDWLGLWKLWPLVFILWGISIMVKNNGAKVLIAGAAGIVLAITLFASFKSVVHLATNDFNIVFDDDSSSDYKYEFTDYSEPFSGKIQTADFRFKAGAGTFTSASDSSSKLFFAHTEGVKDNYELSSRVTDSNAELMMEMRKARFRINAHSMRNRVEMYFNPEPLWDLSFDVGAASVNLDLSPVKVRNLRVGMGAASFKVKLGNASNRTDVSVESGASKVEIGVPENSGCEIRTEGALNSTDFQGFKKINSDLYRTANFDSTANKIYLHISSGVSSLDINRYGREW